MRAAKDDSMWASYQAFNADIAWTGTATALDPVTAVPLRSPVAYTHSCFSVSDGKVRTATALLDSEESSVEEVVAFETLDVDLDGSYSTEHAGGLAIASLLGGRGTASTVLEHSLAASDRERRRVLLSYGESRALEQVLLLVDHPLSSPFLSSLAGAGRPAAHSCP